MLLHLDPAVPAVWRTPTTLQFGVDPVLAVVEVDPADERLIAALGAGIPATGLEAIGGRDRVERLLAVLDPVLDPAPHEATTSVRPEVRIRSAEVRVLQAQLAAMLPAGPEPRETVPEPTPGLLVVDHVVAPAEHLGWLRADRPHLAIVFGERSATVGPLVLPGVTACLRCRDLQRRDADPAWPTIATQLLGRPAAAVADPLLRSEALALGIAALRRGRGPGADAAVRLDLDGGRVELPLFPHPDCGCLGLPA